MRPEGPKIEAQRSEVGRSSWGRAASLSREHCKLPHWARDRGFSAISAFRVAFLNTK